MRLVLSVLLTALLYSSCKKNKECGCVPPPFEASSWKVTKQHGTIAGVDLALTPEQQNSILTFTAPGKYSLKNTVTGAVQEGTISLTNFTSIYGDKVRYMFQPQVSILNQDYIVLLEYNLNNNGIILLGDNITDGIITTLSRQ